jgi:DNA adenine methylase
LQGVTIAVCSFEDCGQYIPRDSFVYFDPPYEPISATSSFTGYAKNGFTASNQIELRDLVQKLSTQCDCMISNSTASLIEDLYAAPSFHKYYVMASRAINSDVNGRGKIREVLVTTYSTKTQHISQKNALFSETDLIAI